MSSSQKGPSRKKKGRSKKAHVLAAAVQKATESFIVQGETIARENYEIKNEMNLAVEDVKATGEGVKVTGSGKVKKVLWSQDCKWEARAPCAESSEDRRGTWRTLG